MNFFPAIALPFDFSPPCSFPSMSNTNFDMPGAFEAPRLGAAALSSARRFRRQLIVQFPCRRSARRWGEIKNVSARGYRASKSCIHPFDARHSRCIRFFKSSASLPNTHRPSPRNHRRKSTGRRVGAPRSVVRFQGPGALKHQTLGRTARQGTR